MIRCECVDKNRVNSIMQRFPVLRLMYNPGFGGIRGLARGGTLRDNRDLAEFVLNECVPFAPRSIRVTRRQEVIFNVLLLVDPAGRGQRLGTRLVGECVAFAQACGYRKITLWTQS
ncbi:MAG: GNAT family N-acetyltransferase, partial [Proteobacteria bacterium]|nr:GNAT family N-acetyltransferase [Pseudomonadota bacterium]